MQRALLVVPVPHQFDDLDLPVVDRATGPELPGAADVDTRVVRSLDRGREDGSKLVTAGDLPRQPSWSSPLETGERARIQTRHGQTLTIFWSPSQNEDRIRLFSKREIGRAHV